MTDIDNIYVSNKAGPNGPNSLLNIGVDAVALEQSPELLESLDS
jgi:hypothetical protein